jgi:hypothetical protein
MSDSPRTDAVIDFTKFIEDWENAAVALADLAKQLELDLACHREENDRILVELARVTAEREQLAAECRKLADSECDKIIAMSDEQVKALSAFQGHHPQDEATLGKQAAQLALLRHERDAALADAELLRERDDAKAE